MRKEQLKIILKPPMAQKITLISAITNEGESFHRLVKGSSNHLVFLMFLVDVELQLRKQPQRKPWMFFLDNAPIHRAGPVTEMSRLLGLPLLFNIPQSPELAPVELFFSVLKKGFREGFGRDGPSLPWTVSQLLSKVPSSTLRRLWGHVYPNCAIRFASSQELQGSKV